MKYAPFIDLGLAGRGRRPPQIGEAAILPLSNLTSLWMRIARRLRR
ncbi:MAG: hypothetical protein HY059_14095 [Proteobacteria bacterium]|nr:hypothetical protein [Pseudomonadota bacterium]